MNGWWAVTETGQGGGLPDTLHGPCWSEEDARDLADRLTADSRARGRRDDFRVVELIPTEYGR